MYCEIENVSWISLEISFVRNVPTKQAWSNTCCMMITIKMTTSFKFENKVTCKHYERLSSFGTLQQQQQECEQLTTSLQYAHKTQVQDLLQIMWNSYICKKKKMLLKFCNKKNDINVKDLQN